MTYTNLYINKCIYIYILVKVDKYSIIQFINSKVINYDSQIMSHIICIHNILYIIKQ